MGKLQASQGMLITLLIATCGSSPVDEGEVVIQMQADIEDLKGTIASIKNLLEEAATENNPCETKVGPPGPSGIPGVAGRDGRDGINGERGDSGRDGVDGRDGTDGRDGANGMPGRDGIPGRDGEKGPTGPPGEQGTDGLPGPVGQPGPEGTPGKTGGGAVYTRWGRTTCGSDASLIYDGFTGGSPYNQEGGGANYQCMVNDAEHNRQGVNIPYNGFLAGTEYQSHNPGVFMNPSNDENAPCAVCYAKSRSSVMMIPGKRTCPSDEWTFEYEGYLMAEWYNRNHQATYECVDADPEHVDGESSNDEGAMFYFTEPVCAQGVPCPPYNSGDAITCVVCTK